MDAVNRIAAKFPDVKFEHASGYKREHPNVSTYNSRPFDGRYVEGVIAAKLAKNDENSTPSKSLPSSMPPSYTIDSRKPACSRLICSASRSVSKRKARR